MNHNRRVVLTLLAVFALVLAVVLQDALAMRASDAGPGPVRQLKGARGWDAFTRALFMHDVGNVRMSLSNWGEQGNPDGSIGFKGFEYPLGSGNDFLFSAGIWVGAQVNGQKLVSTGTDGDNGTNEFAPSLPSDSYPLGFVRTSKQYSELNHQPYTLGIKGVDDDRDWVVADDKDGDGKASENWDKGAGFVGRDDDGDGLFDEDSVSFAGGVVTEIDGDGDGNFKDTGHSGDSNNDGNCNYDPEAHLDEDPAGDISHDFIDNDHDGKVDMDDPDFDGDAAPGLLDDDGDGLVDEDGVARGTQEYYTVYDDHDRSQVQSPDADGHTPLNVQVLQRTYAWGEAYAGEFVIVDLVVRNIGALPLTEVYLGLFADPDIVAKGESGDAGSADDWNFYDAPNLMMIQGDDTTDADGFGPGVFAMKVVRTPAPLDSLNVSFRNFNRQDGGDPATNADKYNMISDFTHNSPPTPAQKDWRFLMGFGPKSGGWVLRPHEELPVTVAFIAGYRIEDARRNAEWAQRIYDEDFQGPAAPDQPVFRLEPTPEKIRVVWEDNSEGSIDRFTKKRDFEGYQIQRSTDAFNWFTLAQFDTIDTLPDEEFQRENLNLGMPYDPLPSDLVGKVGWEWTDASHSHRRYWFDDESVIRGWNYSYIVRAFDQGLAGAGTLITPVGLNYKATIAGYVEGGPVAPAVDNPVEGVFVVPNPYKGSHMQESGGLMVNNIKTYPRKLFFYNLPTKKTDIAIYTLAGDLVVELQHDGSSDQYMWDMRNKYRQEIVSGVYYFIASCDGKKKIDKFVVVK